ILHGQEEWLAPMPPYQGGGEMAATAPCPKTTSNRLPLKRQAGRPHSAAAIGINAPLQHGQRAGVELIEEYEKELLDYALSQLADIDALRLIGEAEQRSGAISFLLDGIHPFDTGEILDKLGIAVRTGHHCTEPIMDYFGIPGTVRASFTFYNNKSDVDRLKEGILRAQKMLK